MPGMDGIELMRRCHSARPELPVIAIASELLEGFSALAMMTALGAAGALEKPFAPAALVSLVDTVMSRT